MLRDKFKKLTVEQINSACVALASNDLAGAWVLLQNADEDDPVALYNKALCQWMAGKYLEALPITLLASGKLQTPIGTSSWKPDNILCEIFGNMQMPKPISTVIAEMNPTFTKIYASWLLALCYLECGKGNEAEKTMLKLKKYNIKLPIKSQNDELSNFNNLDMENK